MRGLIEMKWLGFIVRLSVWFGIVTIGCNEVTILPNSVLAAEQYFSLERLDKDYVSKELITISLDFKKIKNNYLWSRYVNNYPVLIAQNAPEDQSDNSGGGGILFILILIIITMVIISGGAIYGVVRIYLIEQDEVGLVYKKLGSSLPSNRQIAVNGEMGWQAYTWGPGRHLLYPFWMYKVVKEKAIQINIDEIGLVKAKDGASLPTGKMFGKVVEECDDFQDGCAFINNGGQRGQQLAVLRNGIYRINTKLFAVEKRQVTHIRDYEIGLVEAKDGKPLTPGKTFGEAVECSNFEDGQAFINNGGCRGKQLKILNAGQYVINTELFKIKKVEPVNIEANQVGLVEAIDGKPLPLGQNFGKVVECDNFQNAEAFIKNGGQKGKQLAVIPPGTHYINTELFKVRNVPVIKIQPGEIGLVIAQDGAELPPEQILCKTVDCNSFQNAEAFIKNGGQKGKQRAIIPAGEYRINTELFTVVTVENAREYALKPEQLKVYRVESGKIGIVTTFDGKSLPGGDIAGAVIDKHNKFQDPQKFIGLGGYRGLQEEFLEEGSWSLNPWFVEVEQVPLTRIQAGTVGVVISNIGENRQANQEQSAHQSPFNIVPEGYKGIQEKPIEAGQHPINTRVKSIVIVPAHEITLDWTNRDKLAVNYDSNLKTLELRSKDGFTFELEVTQVINIAPKDAPKMISRVGSPNANSSELAEESGGIFRSPSEHAVKYSSIKNLVNRVLEPMVGSYFRNSAQEYDALDFLQQRDEIQEGATEHIKNALNAYGVQAVGTYINEIDLPNELEERIKAQKIAEVESKTWEKELEAEKKLQNLIREKEITESQKELVKADLARQVSEQYAVARERDAKARAEELELLNKVDIDKKEKETDIEIEKQKRLSELEINKKEKETGIETEQKERLAELNMKEFRNKVQTLTPELYGKIESDNAWSEALAKFKYTAPEILIGGGGNGNASGMEALQSGQFQVIMMEMFGEYIKERKANRLNTSKVKSEALIEASKDYIDEDS